MGRAYQYTETQFKKNNSIKVQMVPLFGIIKTKESHYSQFNFSYNYFASITNSVSDNKFLLKIKKPGPIVMLLLTMTKVKGLWSEMFVGRLISICLMFLHILLDNFINLVITLNILQLSNLGQI